MKVVKLLGLDQKAMTIIAGMKGPKEVKMKNLRGFPAALGDMAGQMVFCKKIEFAHGETFAYYGTGTPDDAQPVLRFFLGE